MDFEQRLSKAIERGQRLGDRQAAEQAHQALSEEELKRLHSQYRLQLSEHIENCLRTLPGHFPGFQFETVFGERGWGAAVVRDDVSAGRGRQRSNVFSRLEMVIRPFSSYHVLELAAKGTIHNKELFNRGHFQRLTEVDLASFVGLIDMWVLEFAELFASKD
jgi:hypothetical protein